jgi:hypothetical protein
MASARWFSPVSILKATLGLAFHNIVCQSPNSESSANASLSSIILESAFLVPYAMSQLLDAASRFSSVASSATSSPSSHAVAQAECTSGLLFGSPAPAECSPTRRSSFW